MGNTKREKGGERRTRDSETIGKIARDERRWISQHHRSLFFRTEKKKLTIVFIVLLKTHTEFTTFDVSLCPLFSTISSRHRFDEMSFDTNRVSINSRDLVSLALLFTRTLTSFYRIYKSFP